MNDVPSNNWPINQAALAWLQEAKASPNPDVSYIAQLAAWGFEKNQVSLPPRVSPSQLESHNLENAVENLLGAGANARITKL